MKSNKIFLYSVVIGLAAALFIPFIVSSSQLFPFITGKAFTFRILVEILFGLWCVGIFFDSSIRPKSSWLTWSILVFTAVTFLADFFGHNFYHSFWSNYERMDGFITTVHGVAYFFIASSVLTTRGRWRFFFETSIIGSVMMSVYTFLQLAGKIQINQGGVRVDGTFGNATYLAVYMLFNIFITLFLALGVYERIEKNTKWSLYCWYGIALLFQLISLYYTATRGDILGLIGGLFLTTVCLSIFEKTRPTLRKISIGILVTVLLVVGGFFLIRNSAFVKGSDTLGRFASISFTSLNDEGRRYVWPMAWQGFKEHPVLGWGQENFNYVFSKYYDPRMYNLEPWFDRAHNVVLDWLVTGGVVGLLSYLSLFAASLYLIWKNESLSVGQKSLLFGLLAAYFFQNLFVFDNLISYVYFFSILAFVHSQAVRSKNTPVWIESMSKNRFLSRSVIPTVSVVGVCVLVYMLNVSPIGASQNIIRGLSSGANLEQGLDSFQKAFDANTFGSGEATDQLAHSYQAFVGPNVPAETKQRYASILVGNLDKVLQRFPDDARYLLSMGTTRIRLGDVQGASPYLDKGQQNAPQKADFFYQRGFGYLTLGEYDKAIHEFKTAYEMEQSNSESKVLYIVAALYAKQNTLAASLISEFTKDPNFFDERILAAEVNTGHAVDAVALLQNRAKLLPDDVNLRFRLAAGYLNIGDRSRSVLTLQEISRSFPTAKDQADYYIKEIQAGRDPTKAQ